MKVTGITAKKIYFKSDNGHSVIFDKERKVFYCDCIRGSLQGDACCHKKRAFAILEARGIIQNDVVDNHDF